MDDENDIPSWLEVARSCVSIEDWKLIVKAAVEVSQGTGTDAAKARDFLASFVLPKDRGDPSQAKVREVRITLMPKPKEPDATEAS